MAPPAKRGHVEVEAGTEGFSKLLGSDRLSTLAQRLGLTPSKKDQLGKDLLTMFEEETSPGSNSSSSGGGSGKGQSPNGINQNTHGQNGKGGKGGKGKGRGRFTRANLSLGGKTVADQMSNMKAVVIALCRLVCAHAQEFRRLSKESNQVLAFSRLSAMPAKLEESKQTWLEEIPAKTEENPFPVHADHPWRVAAMICLATEATVYLSDAQNTRGLSEDEVKKLKAAAASLANSSRLQTGLHRFWRLRGGDDKAEAADQAEAEGEAELWIIRFAQNPTGHSLYSALVMLDQSDTVDKCWRATLRPDRAPKGGLQRQIEGLLGNELPQRRQGNGSDL